MNGYYAHFNYQPEIEQGKFDYSKIEQYNKAWRAAQKYNYLERIVDTGSFLKIELERLSKDAGRIGDVRGYGGFLSFDVESVETAQKLEQWFQRQGLQLFRCGPVTFGLRPALSLVPRQAAALKYALKHYSPHAI